MNSIWGAELNYAPDYWPLWLIYAGVIVVLMIAGLVTHALLRRMLAPKTVTGEEHREYLYSLAVRRWHWGNALLFILLLLSGLFGHFSVGPVVLMVQVHTWCGFALLAFWIGFVLINATSGNGCHYRVKLNGLISRCLLQTRFYLYGIMKGEPHPFAATAKDKFNPLQQLAYLAIMYALVPLLIITGLLCLYPQVSGAGPIMLVLHMALAIVGLLFICAHIYLCTLGDTPGQIFRSMFDGYHRHRSHHAETAPRKG
ncbi:MULTISPECIES: thiosulfate reductase cytochrome B subunit [Citrobacter]|uniref:Thiosulfate reductase cytochrome B subunit n=1 Tax=Citrobacter cronae TaxID=1748967 RepID=A0ABS1A263_9ENTR|nr:MULTISPECIES: thiosulfate reductase cytochrome B subunit [Citrobacter]AWS96214.1 thiosulfate reductase cytochrome B subunit [Citrobacter sp. CRE-46]MBJ8386773.1 thiosulfate reductase cytochrome B subunit [Citrobacter cronae]MBJ8389919.1 thiosulfate reductase cytochrome B subunit [Citrobacter cronae]MBX8967365.1 thiosulfate reductase cytochrome B subunit [Citrobacter werkmanii]MBX9014751.1 thiosulfate reductase cytochrome B subunit [Citrobacter werkmanii]